MKLDRIYGYRIKMLTSFVDPAARFFSDHLPVIADVELVKWHAEHFRP